MCICTNTHLQIHEMCKQRHRVKKKWTRVSLTSQKMQTCITFQTKGQRIIGTRSRCSVTSGQQPLMSPSLQVLKLVKMQKKQNFPVILKCELGFCWKYLMASDMWGWVKKHNCGRPHKRPQHPLPLWRMTYILFVPTLPNLLLNLGSRKEINQ